MITTELLALFRQEVVDLETPYLWSDKLVYSYIDDAQKQFCRLTEGIEDATNYTLAIKTDGTVWYAIDPMILKVRSAVDVATGIEVPLIAVEKMSTHGLRFDGRQGPLKALVTGMEKGKVRAVPVPNVAATIELRTFRLPLDVVAGDDLEIDPQHQMNLLFWVKYRAYSVQDADAGDKQRAEFNRAKFHDYCAFARAEQGRVRRPVSTVAYGGI